MDVKSLKRNPGLAKKHFIKDKGGTLMTNTDCSIMIPKRFVEVDMAAVGSENRTIGICAWTVGNEYFITMVNAIMPLSPSSVVEVDVDGDVYILFKFEKNTVVCPNMNLVRVGGVVFQIFTEVLAKARSPWYLNYLDRCNMFDSAPKHAGTSITEQKQVTELIVSANTRLRKDRSIYFRHALKTQEDLLGKDPIPTSLRTVEYSTSSTLTSIAGSYMGRGINRALNNPSERVETIEEYLRM